MDMYIYIYLRMQVFMYLSRRRLRCLIPFKDRATCQPHLLEKRISLPPTAHVPSYMRICIYIYI